MWVWVWVCVCVCVCVCAHNIHTYRLYTNACIACLDEAGAKLRPRAGGAQRAPAPPHPAAALELAGRARERLCAAFGGGIFADDGAPRPALALEVWRVEGQAAAAAALEEERGRAALADAHARLAEGRYAEARRAGQVGACLGWFVGIRAGCMYLYVYNTTVDARRGRQSVGAEGRAGGGVFRV